MKIKAKFTFLCKKFAHNLSILLLTILFIVASIILTIPILFILIFRFVLSKCVRSCHHRGVILTKILTSGATVFATDDMTGRPNLNVVCMITLKGPKTIELSTLRQVAQQKVIGLKDESGRDLYPEFQQYYKTFLGFLFFTPEKDFKIENHIRLYDYDDLDLRNSSKSISIQDLCRIKPNLLIKGWPVGWSPWEFLVVPKYRDDDAPEGSEGEGTVLIFRFHHGIGDGLTFFDILWKSLDNGDHVASAEKKEPSSTRLPKRSFLYYITLPFRLHFDYMKQLVESNDENCWKLTEKELMSAGVESAVTKKISLSVIRDIRNRFNVSFSSVLVAVVAGALRKTMVELNVPSIPTVMHALVPIPRQIRRNNKLRNHLSMIYAKLPVGTKDSIRRLLEADSNLKELKNSTLPLTNGLCHQVAGSLTTPLVRFLQKNVFATVLLSSLPMPTNTCYALGHEMTDITFSTSCHGNNGIRISIMSYNSNLRISVEVNKALPPKSVNLAQHIVDNIETELKNMKNMDTIDTV